MAAWPAGIIRQFGCDMGWLATSYTANTGLPLTEAELHAAKGTPTPQIGALAADQAKAIVTHLRTALATAREAAKNTCWCCGVDLVDGECPHCGDVSQDG